MQFNGTELVFVFENICDLASSIVFSHIAMLTSSVEDSGTYQWISTYCGGTAA